MFSFTQKMLKIAGTATRSPKANSIPPRRNWARNRKHARITSEFSPLVGYSLAHR